jgi:hypothetical protein
MTKTKDKHVILLNARIAESQLSDARFAREVMRVHPRTLRRWKGLYTPIPPLHRAFLENPQPLPWPTQETQ